MAPARKRKTVSFDDLRGPDRNEPVRTVSPFDVVHAAANDDTNFLRQARRARNEWRRERDSRLKAG